MNNQNSDNDLTRSHTPIVAGTMISHYKIIERIGAGGMGEVYLAEDTELDRRVALKFLPQHLCPDEDYRARFRREAQAVARLNYRARFRREAQAVARLNHPNIIAVYEVSEYQGRPFFAMELVEGQSLSELAASKSLGIERIIEIAIQICDGLGAAHEKNVVHRDIKPSNIIIDAYGRPKILDFGLAAIRGSDQITRTGSTLGTTQYMSPEHVENREINHLSDLFSLGVVLYELVTGRTPFGRDNEAATLKAISQENPEPLARYKSDIPQEFQRIISKLLEKDSSVRYQSAAGVISDLKPFIISTGSHLITAPVKRRKRWPLAVGGLVIMAGLLIAGLKYWPGTKTEQPVAPIDERIMLAVLPFENLGADEDEYFADGITGEITSKVGVLEGLGVMARTSILQYKGTTKRISEIGAELNVDYVTDHTGVDSRI
jgi:non-specific serine/threonine protein kinase